MIVSSVFSRFLRRAARWLAVLTALAALGFAAAAAWMFFWVLPNIADHRDTVAQLMSRALGQRVTLQAVSGVWQQTRPEFHLQGVRLYDRQNRPALYLPDLQAQFAWRSLLVLEPRFSKIELQGLTLDVRRARDGHYYVGGIPINPAAPDSGFTDWLLRQGQVHVSQATLTWRDEVRAAAPLVLTAVDFTLSRRLRTHQLDLRATPPASLARPLAITAEMRARKLDDIRTWNGRIEAEVSGVSFAELARWLSLPVQPQQGQGALRVRFDVVQGALSAVTAGVDLRRIETTLGEGLPALQLAQVRGQAQWQRQAGGQQVRFDNLRVALPGGALGEPMSVGLAWSGAAREFSAQAVRLSGWQPMLPSLPMDAALRQRLQGLHAQGVVEDMRLRWKGAQPGLDNFSLTARFRGLGVAASGQQPGVLNLSGRIEGNAQAGRFEIDAPKLAIDLPMLFRESRIGFDQFTARGGWKKTARGRLLVLDALAFANADAAGTASGQYELIAGQPGVIDLGAHLTRADGRAVYRYLPNMIGDDTVDWVKAAVVTGGSNDVRLVLKGDLAKFPFEHGEGAFSVDSQIQGAVIDYAPGWPRIEGIQARMLFKGKTMEVTSSQARIYNVALAPVRAFIPDLLLLDNLLLIEGVARGPAQDFVRYANASPVGDHLRGFMKTLDAKGTMQLGLKMQIPMRHSDDTTLSGKLSLRDNSLMWSGLPPVERARGDIDFTEKSLGAKNIGAQFLGGRLRVDAVTRPGQGQAPAQVQILAQGQASVDAAANWLKADLAKYLAGQTAWRGQIDLLPEGERVRIESDLLGLQSRLPAPLAKPAAQPLPLLISMQPQGAEKQVEVRVGQTVGAVWRSTADGRLARGELRFGGAPVLPAASGLRLAGSGRGLDVSGWLALLPDTQGGEALPLSALDLRFDSLDLLGRRFQDIRLLGANRNGLFRTQVSGRGVNGVLNYRPAGELTARVSAQFRQLTIPDAGAGPVATTPGAEADAMTMTAAEFPQLEVTVEDFRLQARPLGRLEVLAHGTPQGLLIDNLQLTHADSVFRMNGLWHEQGISETRAELNLQVLDAGKFLTRFGYEDALKRGSAKIAGNVSWAGSPADFSLGTLAGQLDFSAREGQFLNINPGAGKLLGVLSLQSLPRRLSLDFRDIFTKGFAFDDMHAALRIARGVVYSDDFKMRGPAATVHMSGLADLNQESVQLRLKVVPKLSEGVAVAGALIGGPLVGVGVLAAQKLMRDPIEEASSRSFMVTGPWLAPEVTRIVNPQPKPDAQANEP
ncbi:YhdP family protein [Thiobacillus sp.]|uniref:YhdP family protein n=1 Tax=Thiobacillus sp. TaxID=924 RepID=UPI0025CC8318|nr:YhdP family protein [Thiobacillus sp.]MBT9539690.1 TIGR02099 family protein [Thiobacillus sp.]